MCANGGPRQGCVTSWPRIGITDIGASKKPSNEKKVIFFYCSSQAFGWVFVHGGRAIYAGGWWRLDSTDTGTVTTWEAHRVQHNMASCAMRGTCGSLGWFGQQLPCPYNGPPVQPENEEFRSLLGTVCGPSLADSPVCCTSEQVVSLRDNLQQAETFISSCPACRNNFRDFWCSFTCSPYQGSFLEVSSTQTTDSGETAVKSTEYYIGEGFGEGFFDSCKSIKFGATNGYAMDLLGGGAKTYPAFLKYMGDVKPGLGSPFQINFPNITTTPENVTRFDPPPRSCSDSELTSRCTCVDCPSVCQVLPPIPAPGSEPICHVGLLSCLSFVLISVYALGLASFLCGYILQSTIQRRRNRSYERVALFTGADNTSAPSPASGLPDGLVGASSLANTDDASGGGGSVSRQNLGRGASLLDPTDGLQPRQHRLDTVLRRFFYRLGYTCASKPSLTFAIAFTLIGLANVGWKRFSVETDPVRLWVSPTSDSKLQKEYFDQHFGPFYRVQQIFITDDSLQSVVNTADPALLWVDNPVLSWDRLKWWFDIEAEIRDLRSLSNGYTLDDVCFKPSGPGGACVVQSVSAWFHGSLEGYNETTWQDHFVGCANQPGECLPDFKQPLSPQYVLGAVPTLQESKDWLQARSLVVTYVISDSLDAAERSRAEEWERELRAYLEGTSSRSSAEAGLRLSWSTGVSLEEELNKSTNTDVTTVVLSYIFMFVYVSLTLGSGANTDERSIPRSLYTWATNFPALFTKASSGNPSSSASISSRRPRWFPRLPIRRLFVGSKMSLGLFGILLVIVSVSTSVGLFSLVGVKVTLIIAEVIPFLVLAVGVDNVFILVHELDRQNTSHGPNAAISPGVNNATPMSPSTARQRSPFNSSRNSIDEDALPAYLPPEERVARALAKMGPSILLSTITETVSFALGATVPMPAVRNFALYAAGSVFLGAILQVTVFVSAMAVDLRRVEANRVDCLPCVKIPKRIALSDTTTTSGGSLSRFFKFVYAPFILQKPVKMGILALFSGVLVVSIISIQHIELGLDQRLALPSDSYLVSYFNALDTFLDVGPPIYFVSRDVDVSTRVNQQQLCARFTTCDDYSIANILEAERKRPESSFISEPAAVWIDDFFHWLDPILEGCCRVRKLDPTVFCSPSDRDRLCQPCFQGRNPPWNITMASLPEGPEFNRYLQQWLVSPTDENCPLGGREAYSAALSIEGESGAVSASHFRTFHSPLRGQADFINSYEAAHRIADDLTKRTGTKVFPYSVHYVFFEQYAHIVSTTQEILGLGLAAVLTVTAFLLGSWRVGTIVTGVVALTVVNIMGVMGAWSISLNALSLVNLVISLGIAVEFCSHVARAFMGSGAGLPVDHPGGQRERDERVWSALVDVGPSVLSGITFTKLIGISVLALTRSKLLEVYYFRMWLTLIISGALHGLVLLPVLLSMAGGPGYALEDADEEWMSTAIRRHNFEYTPFLADDDSVTSD